MPSLKTMLPSWVPRGQLSSRREEGPWVCEGVEEGLWVCEGVKEGLWVWVTLTLTTSLAISTQ